MNSDPASDLVESLLRLGALNVRLSTLMAEAVMDAGAVDGKCPEVAPAAPISPLIDAEVEAAAQEIERLLLADHEIGFQSMLRLNFPGNRIREIARAALNAARIAKHDG